MTPLVLTAEVIALASRFLEDRGADGREGSAMIAAGSDLMASRLVVPDQRATPAPHCSVEVTMAGKLQLLAALRQDEWYVARIHSHPGLAFHSPVDDRNPALTHEGALSIVVPFFGLGLRRGIDACAVYIRRDAQWLKVPTDMRRHVVIA